MNHYVLDAHTTNANKVASAEQKEARMSLKPEPIPSVPEPTARLAHIVCPKGNVCLWIGEELSAVFQDELFDSFFPRRGQPAEAPWRLALVTVLPFVEGLSDRQAAEAVRTRIDWKYALRLELEDRGCDFSVLCEFRARLLQGNGEALLFEALLRSAKERGWLKARGRQRTDSTHVLAAIQTLSRLECVAETLRHALNVLAALDQKPAGSRDRATSLGPTILCGWTTRSSPNISARSPRR
jgi:transposase